MTPGRVFATLENLSVQTPLVRVFWIATAQGGTEGSVCFEGSMRFKDGRWFVLYVDPRFKGIPDDWDLRVAATEKIGCGRGLLSQEALRRHLRELGIIDWRILKDGLLQIKGLTRELKYYLGERIFRILIEEMESGRQEAP